MAENVRAAAAWNQNRTGMSLFIEIMAYYLTGQIGTKWIETETLRTTVNTVRELFAIFGQDVWSFLTVYVFIYLIVKHLYHPFLIS